MGLATTLRKLETRLASKKRKEEKKRKVAAMKSRIATLRKQLSR